MNTVDRNHCLKVARVLERQAEKYEEALPKARLKEVTLSIAMSLPDARKFAKVLREASGE